MVFPKKNADWDYPERGRGAKRASGASRPGADRGPSERWIEKPAATDVARIDPLSGHARSEDPSALAERVVFRLWADGLVNARSVEQARREVDGRLRLDQALARLNLVDGDACAEALAAELGLPVAAPDQFPREAVAPELLPGRFVAEALALPLGDDGQVMTLAMADPIDDYSLRAIAMKTRRRLQVCVAAPGRLEAEISRLYKGVSRSEADAPARRRTPVDPPIEQDRPEGRAAGYRGERRVMDPGEDDRLELGEEHLDDAPLDDEELDRDYRDHEDDEADAPAPERVEPPMRERPRFVAQAARKAAPARGGDEGPLELGPADRTPRQPATPRFVRPRRVTLKDRVSEREQRRDAAAGGGTLERRKISQRRLEALRAEVSARLSEPSSAEAPPRPRGELSEQPTEKRFFAGFVNGFMGVQAGLDEGVDTDDWLSGGDDAGAPSWAERRAAAREETPQDDEAGETSSRRRGFGFGRWRSERKSASGAGQMIAEENVDEFDVARDAHAADERDERDEHARSDEAYGRSDEYAGGDYDDGYGDEDGYGDDEYAEHEQDYVDEPSYASARPSRGEQPLDTADLFAAARSEMGRDDPDAAASGLNGRAADPGDEDDESDASIGRSALVAARDRSKTSAARRLVMDQLRRTLRGEEAEASNQRRPLSLRDSGAGDQAAKDFAAKDFAPLTVSGFGGEPEAGESGAIYQAARAVVEREGREVGSLVRHTLISEPPSVSRPQVAPAAGPEVVADPEPIAAAPAQPIIADAPAARLEISSDGSELEALKFSHKVRDKLDGAMEGGEGLILICGPSGSSKSGTLQALAALAVKKTGGALHRFDKGEARPPIDPEAPAPIFTGEIRDAESAEAAARAAMTGAMVLATLDAPSAAAAAPRLIEMGLPPYVLASSLRAVVAQHLAPKLCARCGARCQRDGCPDCGGRDQTGSVAIVESLVLDDTMRALILAQAPAAAFRHAMTAAEAPSLADDAAEKVAAGLIDARDAERAASAAGM